MITVFTDGACQGNPGHMGIGVVFYQGAKEIRRIAEYIGEGTNNVAEYKAIIRAIETAKEMNEREVLIKSDSELVVKQMNGEYKVRNGELKMLKNELDSMVFGMKIKFTHIPREQNKEADRLATLAIEKKLTKGSNEDK